MREMLYEESLGEGSFKDSLIAIRKVFKEEVGENKKMELRIVRVCFLSEQD